MSEESMAFRDPSAAEQRLLEVLSTRCEGCAPNWHHAVRVQSMDDGGMGSLRLQVQGVAMAGQEFGRRAAEYQFSDVDGVQIIASLNVAKQGYPFELEVWRTDFESVISIVSGLNGHNAESCAGNNLKEESPIHCVVGLSCKVR